MKGFRDAALNDTKSLIAAAPAWNASVQELQEKHDSLKESGKTLCNAIDAIPKESLKLEIVRSIDLALHPVCERARHTNPKIISQMGLRNEFTFAEVQGSGASNGLIRGRQALNVVRGSWSKDSGADGEREYLRELKAARRDFRALKELDAHYSKDGGQDPRTPEERQRQASTCRLIEALPGYPDERPNYPAKLRSLRQLRETAAGDLSLARQRFVASLDELATLPRDIRSKATIALVTGAGSAELQALSPNTQVQLLTWMRDRSDVGRTTFFGAPVPMPPGLYEAEARLYNATRLEPELLQEDKKIRKATVDHLMQHHKAQMQRAARSWPHMDSKEKLRVLELVIESHCETGHFSKPTKVFFQNGEPALTGSFRRDTGAIVVNPDALTFDDFEATLDMVFHENTHNWQYQLSRDADALERDGSKLAPHAKVFRANFASYHSSTVPAPLRMSSKEFGYSSQPVEMHAFMAGRKFARDLTSTLLTGD